MSCRQKIVPAAQMAKLVRQVAGCPSRPKALTGVDLAYLRALYKMTTTANLNGQRDEMIYQMEKGLGASSSH